MAKMRAQLSLQFTDETLFFEFIKPYKEERLLNNLIIKCLTAYYYNDEVRDKIESASGGSSMDDDSVTSTQEICDSIRQALVMQDFMVQELQNVIDTGSEDITNILSHTNEMAEETGVAKTTSSSSGSSMLKIGMNISETKNQNEVVDKTGKFNDIDSKLNLVIKAVEILAKASGNIEVSHLFADMEVSSNPVDSEIARENSSTEVHYDDATKVQNFGDIEVEEDMVVEGDTSEDIDAVDDFADTSEMGFSDVASMKVQTQSEVAHVSSSKVAPIVPSQVAPETVPVAVHTPTGVVTESVHTPSGVAPSTIQPVRPVAPPPTIQVAPPPVKTVVENNSAEDAESSARSLLDSLF